MFELNIHAEMHIHLCQVVMQMVQALHGSTDSICKATVILHEGHWFPLVAIRGTGGIELLTSSDRATLVDTCMQAAWGDNKFILNVRAVQRAFAHDCGFQAVGFVLGVISQKDTPCQFSEQQACEWRSMCHKYLIATGDARNMVLTPLRVGGGKSVVEDLANLVSQHGVASSRSHECASHLVSTLGRIR